MKLINTLFFALVCFSFACCTENPSTSIVKSQPGDVIYSKCQDVTIGGVNLNDACVSLTEGTDCGLDVLLTIQGNQIFEDNLDLAITPEVCGNYTSNGVTCFFCISVGLNPQDNTQRCVMITPTCSGITFAAIDAGCFNDSELDDIVACENSLCPHDCSGHGTCVNGVCQCESSFYGDDCSFTSQIFFRCQRVDETTGNLCVRVTFAQCAIGVQMVLEGGETEVTIYDENYRIAAFKQIFQDGQCADAGACDACLSWDNLVLNDSQASGCGSLAITCVNGYNYNYPIGCFEDDQVVPQCFGSCPNDCSSHGTCVRGLCQCNAGYGGDDCSTISNGCPNQCSGNGNCGANNKCTCFDGFAGTDCSIKKTTGGQNSSSTGQNSKFPLLAVMVPIGVIGALAIVGFAVWYIRRRNRAQTPQFTQLDLITAEDDDEEELMGTDE